jgi:hypothetical protein
MVSRTRSGLTLPEEAFADLRPYRDQLLKMSQAYRPGGPEYMALSKAVMALDKAAGVVMNRSGFYLSQWHSTHRGGT